MHAEDGGQRSAMRWLTQPKTANTTSSPSHLHSRGLAQQVAMTRRRQVVLSTACLLVFVVTWVHMTLSPQGVAPLRRGTSSPSDGRSTAIALQHAAAVQPQDVFNDVPMDVEPIAEDAIIGDEVLISKRELLMEDVALVLDAASSSHVGRRPEPDGQAPSYTQPGADADDSPALSDSAIPSDDVFDQARLSPVQQATRAMIGPTASCNTATCRLCNEMQLTNQPAAVFVGQETLHYMRRHLLLSTVTGSFDRFFRVDVALCTWLGHVPNTSLLVFTDGANKSDGRHGQWFDAALPPTLRFSKQQMQAQGYTIDWMRAQYRFVQAFQAMASRALIGETSAVPATINRDPRRVDDREAPGLLFQRELHWAMVVDDDTFVDVNALHWLLTAYDVRELVFLGLVHEKIAYNVSTAPTLLQLISTHRASFRPLYLNDAGWGGAGHYLNYAALRRFANGSDSVCVERYMVRRGMASDVALKKCLPRLGIHTVNEKHLSHCQAAFLKRRLTSGRLVSSHAKRDIAWPRYLALWRMRLYYQVVYHRNHTTAYDLLMRVGACAYGYSCKLKKCDAAHDAAAMALFNASSNNNSFVPCL